MARRRIKPSFPKRWKSDCINSYKPPNRQMLAEYSARARAVDDAKLNAMRLCEKIPGGGSEPRLKVFEKIRAITEDIPRERSVVLKSDDTELTLLWSHKQGKTFLTKTLVGHDIEMKSCYYPDSGAAIQRFKSNRVLWTSVTDLK